MATTEENLAGAISLLQSVADGLREQEKLQQYLLTLRNSVEALTANKAALEKQVAELEAKNEPLTLTEIEQRRLDRIDDLIEARQESLDQWRQRAAEKREEFYRIQSKVTKIYNSWEEEDRLSVLRQQSRELKEKINRGVEFLEDVEKVPTIRAALRSMHDRHENLERRVKELAHEVANHTHALAVAEAVKRGEPWDLLGYRMKHFSIISLVALFISVPANAETTAFTGPSGRAVYTTTCKGSTGSCYEEARSYCRGPYQIVASYSRAGGLIIDFGLPGPATYYSMSYVCGPSDGRLASFPSRGPEWVPPRPAYTNCAVLGVAMILAPISPRHALVHGSLVTALNPFIQCRHFVMANARLYVAKGGNHGSFKRSAPSAIYSTAQGEGVSGGGGR